MLCYVAMAAAVPVGIVRGIRAHYKVRSPKDIHTMDNVLNFGAVCMLLLGLFIGSKSNGL